MDSTLHAEQEVPSGFLTRIRFNILTEEDAEKASVKEIRSGNEVTDPALGIPNPSSQCSTCGAKDGRNCEGHFGLIKFPFTILHPYFLPEVAQILNKICPGCKSIWHDKNLKFVREIVEVVIGDHSSEVYLLSYRKKCPKKRIMSRPIVASVCHYLSIQECNLFLGSSKEIYPPMKFRVSAKDVFGKTAIIAEVNEKLSKKGGGLAPDYWDFIPNDPQQGENYLKPNKRVISHAQVYNMLKDVDPRFLEGFLSRKNSIFLNCFPVTPNCHRVTEFGHNVMFVRREKPSTTDTASNFTPKASGLKYIKEIILGKRTDHIFRMVVVGDPNIKLDEIGIPCHIAEAMQISEQLNSWNLRKLMNSCYLRILEKGQTLVRRKGTLVRHGITDKLQIGDTVYRPLNDGDVVLINRPPAIHPHSLLALSVKILPINSVLSVNPLICSPLRGDFDGDCLHGYVPQSVDCRVELRELAALNKQLINGQSGRNLLSLSHDSLTAAHLLLEDGVFLNKYQMQQLQMFCPRQLQIPSIIKAQSPDDYFTATSSNSCLWTGKQLFSLLLPPDFDYSFPSNGVHISKGELVSSSGGSSWLRDIEENLFCSLVKHCQEDVLDFLYAAQEVFCEWLSMRGLSVSLSDLYLSPDSNSRQNMTDEVSCGLQEAKRVSHIKLLMVDSNRDFLIESSQETEIVKSFGAESMCYEQQTSAALSRASVSAFKQIFWDIQNLAYQYSSKENSFLAMLKAGSKGNLLKLVQHSMCLGLQHSLVPLSFRFPHQLSCAAWNNQKSISALHRAHDIVEHAESYIPFAVVENSFLTGLNPLEFFVHSVTTRDNSFGGHADISGTLNRKLMFFMRDLYVGYDGTVRNAYGNQLVQFSYNVEDMSSPSNSPNSSLNDSAYNCEIGGKPVGSLAASAISEAAYCALDQPFSALESSPLLNLKKVLECGVKKTSGDRTASLFLSKKLGRWIHGFEYGALEVKSHLERVLFSEIVSAVMVFFSPETRSRTRGPWICHFHISKEIAERKRLKVQAIIHALCIKCNCDLAKSRINFPKLQITSNDCTEMQNEKDATICIAVSVYGSPKSSSVGLNMIRDMVIPFLLGTVIKGQSS
ncbi:hypothetical protein RJ640_018808 [Escallonia rubra]|uniref:DNA-directed RNA polymerase subunit n=1 Tax=Escallonia rubra TaxID=112253 RepID=A0AA88S9J2_9ASTE|nr:hypothetical protein RJ640_018808 [Escallonia rubra]